MGLNRSVKAIIALLAIAVVLTCIIMVQTPTPKPLNVDNGALVNVSKAKVAWTQTYGGSADDRAFYTLPVGDNFLVVGSTKSVNGSLMGWALMLDAQGAMLWNHTYLEGSGTEIRSAVQLSDGYLFIGNQYTASDINGYVAKVDTVGGLIWQTAVGGSAIEKLFSGAVASDGFVFCGMSYSNSDTESTAWTVKLDIDGQMVWNNVYNGTADCALRSMVASSDGTFVAAGYVNATDGNYDFYLQKSGADGSLIWNRTYGGVNSEKAYSIKSTPSGYVLAGDVTSSDSNTDAFVVRVDSSGALVWSRTVGGGDFDSATYITSAKNGGFLVCGFTFSFGEGNRDFWLFSISDDGSVGFSLTYGNSAFQEAYGVIDAGDGQYVMVGWTDPLGQPDLVGKATYDYYIVKLGVSDSTSTSFTLISSVVIFALLVSALVLLILMRKNKK